MPEQAGMYLLRGTRPLGLCDEEALEVVQFDLNRLEVTGAATRLEEVSADTCRGFAQAG